VAKIRKTTFVKLVEEWKFDDGNYEGVTDYKGNDYPEIKTVYDAVRWERQELTDPEVLLERAVNAIADNGVEDDVTIFWEVLDDEDALKELADKARAFDETELVKD
jgi:hypothetical protein